MNRRDFIKLLGLGAMAAVIPASIADAIRQPEKFAVTLDEWHRIFTEELAPLELLQIETVENVRWFGSTVRGLVANGNQRRYFAFIVDEIEKRYEPEEFVREMSRDVKKQLMIGFSKRQSFTPAS